MRLLIVTQKVDKNDPILGFFHRWIEEFARKFEGVVVICLEKGEYTLPENVKVLSLGKEEGKSKAEYLSRFYRYIWSERRNYDTAFVHMNQEYVLLAGDLWRLMGKKVFLWRNHPYGNFLTRMAIFLSHKVFYTSPQSWTARFRKSVQMPVGIDTEFFKPSREVQKLSGSILFLGRISRIKRVLEFVDWLKGRDFSRVTIAGEALSKDVIYENLVRQKVTEYGLSNKIAFMGSVTQEVALKLYQSHETYVNMTPAGSYDKTIFEAAACEVGIKVDNPDLKFLEGKSGGELREFVVKNHSLSLLIDKIYENTSK